MKCQRAAHLGSADKLHRAGHLTDVADALLSFLYGTEGFHDYLAPKIRTLSVLLLIFGVFSEEDRLKGLVRTVDVSFDLI